MDEVMVQKYVLRQPIMETLMCPHGQHHDRDIYAGARARDPARVGVHRPDRGHGLGAIPDRAPKPKRPGRRGLGLVLGRLESLGMGEAPRLLHAGRGAAQSLAWSD